MSRGHGILLSPVHWRPVPVTTLASHPFHCSAYGIHGTHTWQTAGANQLQRAYEQHTHTRRLARSRPETCRNCEPTLIPAVQRDVAAAGGDTTDVKSCDTTTASGKEPQREQNFHCAEPSFARSQSWNPPDRTKKKNTTVLCTLMEQGQRYRSLVLVLFPNLSGWEHS